MISDDDVLAVVFFPYPGTSLRCLSHWGSRRPTEQEAAKPPDEAVHPCAEYVACDVMCGVPVGCVVIGAPCDSILDVVVMDDPQETRL